MTPPLASRDESRPPQLTAPCVRPSSRHRTPLRSVSLWRPRRVSVHVCECARPAASAWGIWLWAAKGLNFEIGYAIIGGKLLSSLNPLPSPGTCALRARGRRDRPAAAEAVPRAPRGCEMAPRDRLKPLHIPTSGLFRAEKGNCHTFIFFPSSGPEGGPPMAPFLRFSSAPSEDAKREISNNNR